MRTEIKSLLELQELEIIVDESAILHKKTTQSRTGNVQERIDNIRAAVPQELLKRYDQLRRKGLAVAKEAAGVCSACRLNVPVGDLNRMHNGVIPWVCPNCGRFLLLTKRN